MKKLQTALKVGGYYDDELVELNNRYDRLLEDCQDLRRKCTLRPPRKPSTEEESNSNAPPDGAWPELEGCDPAFDPGGFPDRGCLVDIMQRLVLPQTTQPLELLAETARQEVLEVVKPQHTLEAIQQQLLAFFQRRRSRLTLQCELIASRLRGVRNWSHLRQSAPAVQKHLRTLSREIEAADARIKRLGAPTTTRMRKSELQQQEKDRPIPKSCTKKKLFDYNEVYRESASTRIFRHDIVVCLREMVWSDRSTRMLRRFLLQVRHLAVTHRQELWRCTLQLARGSLEEGAGDTPLPLLWEPRKQLADKLMDMAECLQIRALLEQDSGHTLASNVAKMFPEILARQDEELNFAAYPKLRRQPELARACEGGSSADLSAKIHLVEDNWLDCIPLHPHVSLHAQEQRAVMQGRMEGPVETDRGSCLNESLQKEVEFLSADARTAESRLLKLAAERAALSPSDFSHLRSRSFVAETQESEDTAEGLEQSPQHLLNAFLLMRHLSVRSLRRELLGLLNLFRFVQQKLSHGVLLLQASATSRSRDRSNKKDIFSEEPERQKEQPLLVGDMPPSFPLAFPVSCRGLAGPRLRDALMRLSEAEYTLPKARPGDLEEVVDGNGLKVLHSSALADLEKVEQEMLIIASYALEKVDASTKVLVDAAGLLAEVHECEVALCRAKWRLVSLQLSAFEKASVAKWDIAQRIVDVMAQRPCFDIATGSFKEAYRALIAALDDRESLQRTLIEYQLRREALSVQKLHRQAQVSLRCGRRLELDLGHQRERATAAAAWQPSPLAGPEMEEDPQLCIEDMLAHPMEGLPTATNSLLDFSDSLAISCQVDELIEACAIQLSDLAPEPSFRHHWERACCTLLAKEWQEHVAQAAVHSPGVGTNIGIRGISDEAQASSIFWSELADDPNWLLLQTEKVILKWQSDDAEGPGPCRKKDPELAWAPFNEAVLRLTCRLLDQVRMRRQLLDALCEVRALEVGLGRQAQLVGAIENLRVSDTLPDLAAELGDVPSSKGPAPLLAAEAMFSFGHLDFSSGAGVRSLLEVDHMHELHHAVQHQISGKWLLVGCILYNALLGDSLLRRDLDNCKGNQKACMGRPWPPPEELEEPLPKITPKLMQWPGAVRTVVYTQVGASMRETVRGLARQVELLPTADSRTSCLAIYRCRSLAYSSLFMLERGCDLLLRVQAARSCAGLRSLASILPPQLSPFKISVEGRRRMLLESDGTVQSIFHVPQVEEVLYLRGTECPSIGRHVRDCEVSMPEPFAQLTEVEEAEAKLLPHDHPVLPPQIVVGSSTSAWAQPTVPVSFTGTAVSTMLLLHEICAITGLAMFSASMSGDQILLLQALHAVEAAWGNKAQRAAAEHVLSQSMLDTAQIDNCERHPKPRSLEQRTWDALEHVRADFLLLEAQVKALREERHQVRPVLQLLRQQHRFLKLGALVLCREAWHAAVQKKWLPEAAELQRWALHLEGFPLEGGCRLALAVSAMPEMIGMPRKEFPALTDVMAGQEETEPEAITEFEAGADEALERLWMSSPEGRAPFPKDLAGEDEIRAAEACLLPNFRPEDCSHLHPLFHALCLHFAAPGDGAPFSQGEAPSFVPIHGRAPWSMPLPRAMCRALLMLPGKMRRHVADIHLRMEMQCDLIGRGSTDSELLEEAECLVQTRYAVQRLREVATTFLLLVPATPTPKGFQQAEELLTRELRRREEENRRKERDVDPEEEVEEEPKAEELIEGSQSVEQLKAKQAQMALELAIKVAGETATAAERAADFEGDWLIMAKGGPGAQVEQEAGRVSVKNSLIDCHDAIVRTVGIIVKCGLRFAAAGIERLKKHMDSCLNSEGGVAALAFAQHLLSRANFVQTFCKDGQHAWIIKHCDLQESLEEIGRRMLQCAIVSTADQVASARERIAQSASRAKVLEEKLLKVRLSLWHQRRDVKSMLNTMASDRVQREIFELDRLHRAHRAVSSAALEAEHRCNVNLHEEIVQKLGSLDNALSYSQSCFSEYRHEMFEGVQSEMRKLKQLMGSQLQKMPIATLALQNAMKKIERDVSEKDEQANSTLKQPEPVQPQSAVKTFDGEAPSESYVEAPIIGPGRPELQPGSQVQRKAALEEMHQEIAQMHAAGTRIHTFYDLKCQQLQQYYDEELHRLCASLSSNRQVWENVSEGRERQRLLGEEIARSARRCEDANGEARQMMKAIDEHDEYTKKMFNWKRKMLKAQGDLQHEMRKYERDGLVDVSKMESELGKLDAQLQHLSTSVPADQLIELIQRRSRVERLNMKRTMRHEGHLLHKAAAKVQVIRAELEKGAQDQEDEPFAELLMEECEALSRRIVALDQENKVLQDQLLKTGDIDLMVYQPRAERSEPQTWQPPSRAAPEAFRDTTFEQDLCFSVSFMKPPRGTGKARKQIDHSHGGGTQMPDMSRFGKSESLRAAGGLTPRRPVPPRF